MGGLLGVLEIVLCYRRTVPSSPHQSPSVGKVWKKFWTCSKKSGQSADFFYVEKLVARRCLIFNGWHVAGMSSDVSVYNPNHTSVYSPNATVPPTAMFMQTTRECLRQCGH